MSEYTALLNYVHKIAQPERLTAIESWHRHIPFAFAVLQMTRPSVFVELGTHRGDSYSAFCQGVTLYGLGTHCYAVDTWQGDSQAGYYGDDIYNELSAWHDPRYARFSSLLRMTFDDALAHFADGTVDLLHIDGLHTYDAVRHDFESWLPKLSSRGVVLFHDTNVRRDDFGVWQLWEELSQRYPAFEFPYGFGLGVLVVGQDAPQEMLDFIAYAQREPQHVIDVFHGLGDAAAYRKASEALVQTRDQLASIGSQLMEARAVVVTRDEQLAQLNQHIREVTEQREALVAERQRLGDDLLHAREVVQTRDGQLASLARRISEHEAELNDLRVLRQAFQQLQQTLQVEDAERTRLEALLKLVLNSRFWRMRNSLMGLLGKHESVLDTRVLRTSDRALRGPRPTIDIIIPVYRSIDDTRRCIESVLASDYTASAQIIVINDASPEPGMAEWLDTLQDRMTVLHNERNLGFVATVNRGMSLHPDHDVVLVNSDTEVANDWLDRLQSAAYSDARVGSVTPFSNNATICSYPQFCRDNALPEGYDVGSLDRVFRDTNAGCSVDIPTAVGFCMFIRRDCLVDAGLFDAERFGRGYGEENEFCMRSAERGWRHLLCGDTFVYHKGGVSFAETQSENQKNGHRALIELFPNYDVVIQEYVARDPAAFMRFAVDAARASRSGLPVVLMVNHNRGGGTSRHLHDLAQTLTGRAHVYLLTPQEEGGRVRLGPLNNGSSAQLLFDPVADFERLLQTLRRLGVARIHFHHTIGVHLNMTLLPERLSVPYDVTIHDYYLACPQVTLADVQGRYCGAPDEAGCNRCLESRPAPGGVEIHQWRQFGERLLNGAERVFAPSQDTARRIQRYFPDAVVVYAPHESTGASGTLQLRDITEDRPLRVVVLGALSVFKGADLLEQCALYARAKRLPVEFHLMGYAYRALHVTPVSQLRIHGAYDEAALPALLEALQPDLVWFPGSCPETYSYTLSAALAAQLPILASRIGALPERLAGRPWTWLAEPDQTPEALMALMLSIREQLCARVVPEPVAESEATVSLAAFSYDSDYVVGAASPQRMDFDDRTWVQSLRHLGVVVETHAALGRYPRLWKLLRHLLSSPRLRPLLASVPYTWKLHVKKWMRLSA